MIIYPAIDLRNGQCVRLKQGEKKQQTTYSSDPVEMALTFQKQGAEWLHVVDLDSAFDEEKDNKNLIKEIAKRTKLNVQTGGGIRGLDEIEVLLNAGVKRTILGTIAVRRPALVENAVSEFGAEAIAVAIDARDGRVAIDGWESNSGLDALAFGKKMQDLGVELAIFTDIARDGMLNGVNIDALQLFLENTDLHLIASGGVRDLNDLRALKKIEDDRLNGAILGRSLYEGTVKLEDVFALIGTSHAR